MKIEINNHRKIFAIQDEFSELFPGLSIAFYAKPSHPGAAPSSKLIRHSGKTLSDCRINNNDGTMEILPTMNVSELKNNLRDVFGLSVEIFLKPKENAAEVSAGDDLILGEATGKSFQ
jgi:hypothetical protein